MPLKPAKLYLLSYNSLQFLGWSLVLSRVLAAASAAASLGGAYASAGALISLLQTAAFMEVVHAAVGLVPSGATMTLMQWGGRTHFLLAIARQIAEVQSLPSVFITFSAWSMSEVIRYSHYALSCIGICPSWLTYIRYTAFILLYPIGLFPGESEPEKHYLVTSFIWNLVFLLYIYFDSVLLMYRALPFIKEKNLYSNFFDRLPFSYYYFIVALLVCYPLLWFKLYLHLLKQRQSKLGKHQTKKKA